ncbi:hypothetical protein [Zooshikella harenae]|uniref:Uncharacterized protein n=1 Tax=Zooshikella harenae TaxID=2827238 RepID=A0ABS5Z875_9GAMM|nr:hypothetical protein [Zooshikella harenae]MBU2710128.1 hypothetical protein [Zooshikella harenae]
MRTLTMSSLTNSSLKQLQQAVAEMQQMEAALALSYYQCSEVIKQMQQVREAFGNHFMKASPTPIITSSHNKTRLQDNCSYPPKNK